MAMSIPPSLVQRVGFLKTIEQHVVVLSPDEVRRVLALALDHASDRSGVMVEDLSGLRLTEVEEWLKFLLADQDMPANLVWLQYQAGVRTTVRSIVACFSELWFPGADDVVLCDPLGSWSIRVSHEEVALVGGSLTKSAPSPRPLWSRS
jgi:hypothetical protein